MRKSVCFEEVLDAEVIPYGFSFLYALENDPSLRMLYEYYRHLLCAESRALGLASCSTFNKKLSDIPHDCVLIVFEYLDSRSLCASQSVCQDWKRPTTLDVYWENLCIKDFNASPASFVYKKQVSLKTFYAEMYSTLVNLLYGKKKESQDILSRSIPAIHLPPIQVQY